MREQMLDNWPPHSERKHGIVGWGDTQPTKCISGKHKNLTSDPRTHIKKKKSSPGPGSVEVETDPWDLLSSQASLVDELQDNERL